MKEISLKIFETVLERLNFIRIQKFFSSVPCMFCSCAMQLISFFYVLYTFFNDLFVRSLLEIVFCMGLSSSNGVLGFRIALRTFASFIVDIFEGVLL